jgi:catechol 2,3-dioxygenase
MAAPKPTPASSYVADPGVRIGHVHLKVANLERAIGFYGGVLGLQVTQYLGDSAAFLSAGGYHHHIGLNTWESLDRTPPPRGTTGLYHTAIVYPNRPALATALKRVLAARIKLEGAADHGVSQSIYLRDPDDNGVELYCDRPKDKWPRTPEGKLEMYTRPLDLHSLLEEAPEGTDLPLGPEDL